jgi:hypothetical protein
LGGLLDSTPNTALRALGKHLSYLSFLTEILSYYKSREEMGIQVGRFDHGMQYPSETAFISKLNLSMAGRWVISLGKVILPGQSYNTCE